MYKEPSAICSVSVEIPVSFHDTDAMGVVWHGNYLKYFEIAREALFDQHGYDYQKMQNDGWSLPVVDTQLHYRTMISVFDKVITVTAFLTSLTNKVTVDYKACKADGTLCCFGSTTLVAFDVARKELSFALPQALLDAFPERLRGERD